MNTKQEVIELLQKALGAFCAFQLLPAEGVRELLNKALKLLEDVNSSEPELPKFKLGDIVRLWNQKIAKIVAKTHSTESPSEHVWFIEERPEAELKGESAKMWTHEKNLTLLIPAEPQELDGVREGDVVEKHGGIVGRVLTVQQTSGYLFPYCVRSSGGLTWCRREDIKRVITFGSQK